MAKKQKLMKLTNDELKLIDDGDIIGAIKAIRARAGLTLKDAKDVVDAVKAVRAMQLRPMHDRIEKPFVDAERQALYNALSQIPAVVFQAADVRNVADCFYPGDDERLIPTKITALINAWKKFQDELIDNTHAATHELNDLKSAVDGARRLFAFFTFSSKESK